jgi:hypothetical protein
MTEYVYPVYKDYSFDGRGLTKREHFAALAMQGLTASGEVLQVAMVIGEEDKKTVQEIIAVAALKYADALIKELGRNE